jgi:hypothetical protein
LEINRKVSVASMMERTDDVESLNEIQSLGAPEGRRSLSVAAMPERLARRRWRHAHRRRSQSRGVLYWATNSAAFALTGGTQVIKGPAGCRTRMKLPN